jgi:hypothetical protein
MGRIVIASLLLAASSGADRPVAGIGSLVWLQGCWEARAGDRVVEEQWMLPRAGSMLGMSRTVRGEALAKYELVVIRERADRLAYEAHPSGQPAAEFLSTSVSDREAVFENPDHDFPQRVGYRREGSSLTAWVEGTRGGKSRRIEFMYRRAACPAD